MQKPKEYWLIVWADPATDYDGWFDIGSMVSRPEELVFSVGWHARKDETYLYVTMDWSMGKGNTVGKIPLSAIKYLKKVKLVGFPAPKYLYPEEVFGDPNDTES